MSGEEQGKRLRDALCDVTRPQGLSNRLWVGLWGPVMNKLESRTIKEPVDRIIYDQLTEMQFLYDVKMEVVNFVAFAGMNRLKQRRNKQSQLIKGCIFKQSKFK